MRSVLSSVLRTTAGVLALVALIAVGLVFGESGAGAARHGELTIRPGEVLEERYPTILGNNPANQASNPESCQTAIYCDVVRLNIVQPDDPDQGYFVRIQMSWATRAEQDVPELGEMTDNDMDMFLYKVPYDPEGEDSDQQITSGATGAQPETAFVSAEATDIVVVNYLGVNTEGYSLKVTYVLDETFTPFELLEDDSPLPDLPGAVEAIVEAPAALPEAPVIAAVASPGLTSVGVDDPFGLSSLGAPKTAPVDLFRPVEAVAAGPAKPVSTAVALLWLAVVPGALLGSVALFLARRQKSSFGL